MIMKRLILKRYFPDFGISTFSQVVSKLLIFIDDSSQNAFQKLYQNISR